MIYHSKQPTKQFQMTRHAREKVELRWPNTVLRPTNFDFFAVSNDMEIIGYRHGAWYYRVTGTPMVAVVENDAVTTVYHEELANRRLQWQGFDKSDFRDGNRAA